MAAKTQGYISGRNAFLNSIDSESLRRGIEPLQVAPSGDVVETQSFLSEDLSVKISDFIIEKLNADPRWINAQPILLGSWGRNELCPKSDLDVLFLAPEEMVKPLVDDLLASGIRLRYRIPEDSSDWSVGVDVMDWLALFGARALSAESEEKLKSQQHNIFQNIKNKKQILKRILLERKERAQRLDSIANFLEPNLKYGAGGLRDIFQGLVICELFLSDIETDGYERKVLRYYLKFFLSIRQCLHLNGYSDSLVATEQFELAKIFGFQSQKEFMRQVQRGISRVSFYSDWIVALALEKSSAKKMDSKKLNLKRIQNYQKPFSSLGAMVKSLKTDSSVLNQHRVRRDLDRYFGTVKQKSKVSFKIRGKYLKEVLNVQHRLASDEWLKSVFDSRLIDKLCPRIVPLVGYVQHDQYHRYPADVHLMQACREAQRIFAKPKLLGAMTFLNKSMSTEDWNIVSWSCLYHDLAKGQEQIGRLNLDHSQLGEEWVREDFKKFGFSDKFIKEVQWLVKNHLEFSIAAFRKNPRAPSTWSDLNALDLDVSRLRRLAVFTAIDIRATNPEAWNDWKAKLMSELFKTLEAGSTKTMLSVFASLKKLNISLDLLQQVDLQIFESFSAPAIAADIKECVSVKSSNSENGFTWKIVKDKKGKVWIRYYNRNNEAGLLSEVLDLLYSAGCSVQHALVHTIPELGVYDWFQVQTSKEMPQLKTILEKLRPTKNQPNVQFMEVELVSATQAEWIYSFKGLDQKGLLLRAATTLKDLGCDISSARVHTWGRQIQDLIHIVPSKNCKPGDLLIRLQEILT